MFFKYTVTILIALLSGLLLSAAAIAAPSIEGTWRASDGSGSARIAVCAEDPATFCATELTVTSSETVAGRIVVQGLRQTSANKWRGTYLTGKETLAATIELRRPDLAAMTACQWVFCDTLTYERVTE